MPRTGIGSEVVRATVPAAAAALMRHAVKKLASFFTRTRHATEGMPLPETTTKRWCGCPEAIFALCSWTILWNALSFSTTRRKSGEHAGSIVSWNPGSKMTASLPFFMFFRTSDFVLFVYLVGQASQAGPAGPARLARPARTPGLPTSEFLI